MCFIVGSLHVLTTYVTVCVCHAELKGYLLTYLFTHHDLRLYPLPPLPLA